MTEGATAYRQLEARFARIAHIDNALGILHWDSSTMMRDGSAEARAEATAGLHALAHEMIAAPETADLLDAAEETAKGKGGLDDWRTANLREMRRRWVHAAAVPTDLVEAASKASSACEMRWREARPKADFAAVRDALETTVKLEREVAAAKAETLGCSPYEALLDQHEPGMRRADVDRIFDRLAAFLPDFIEAVLSAQAERPAPIVPEGPFPPDKQKALGERFMAALGFDFTRGRLDISLHPFCGGSTDDVRITTRYEEADFTQGLMGILHETGHALYELGLPAEWRSQPVGDARSTAMHESQSLLIEMQACRSRAFLDYAAPIIAEVLGGSGDAWTPENLYRLYTTVDRSLIRVDADEVTYPAHVILRYRIETALIAGDLAVADLPGAFDDGLEDLLGVRPRSDRDGCLQDIHWYAGIFGYFPTYTLGAMSAAQIFDAARTSDPDIVPGIARGDFTPLLSWLRANVHARASLLGTDDLMAAATGKPLDPAIFETHLRTRYLEDS